VESQPFAAESAAQSSQELTAKDTAEHLDR
jgi:hypothetical protein